MNEKQIEITKDEYLAMQNEYDETMNHYDKDGYCHFCGRHQDEGNTTRGRRDEGDVYVAAG